MKLFKLQYWGTSDCLQTEPTVVTMEVTVPDETMAALLDSKPRNAYQFVKSDGELFILDADHFFNIEQIYS